MPFRVVTRVTRPVGRNGIATRDCPGEQSDEMTGVFSGLELSAPIVIRESDSFCSDTQNKVGQTIFS